MYALYSKSCHMIVFYVINRLKWKSLFTLNLSCCDYIIEFIELENQIGLIIQISLGNLTHWNNPTQRIFQQ